MSEKFSDRYERLYPLMLYSWSNVFTSLNLALVMTLFMLGYLFISTSEIVKKGLLMTSDSSLGEQIIKSKTDSFFGYTAFFTHI